MIEKWRGSLNQSGACAALLTDLSKAFNCLPHELIIAKLYAYEIHMPLLKVINSYSFARTQRIKMNVYSSWPEMLFDIPQSSILGALLFNIFICDLFVLLPKDGIANYDTDDNTLCSTGNRIHNILDIDILLKWFIYNYLKAYRNKYHALLSEISDIQLTVENVPIGSSSCEKLFGIKI